MLCGLWGELSPPWTNGGGPVAPPEQSLPPPTIPDDRPVLFSGCQPSPTGRPAHPHILFSVCHLCLHLPSGIREKSWPLSLSVPSTAPPQTPFQMKSHFNDTIQGPTPRSPQLPSHLPVPSTRTHSSRKRNSSSSQRHHQHGTVWSDWRTVGIKQHQWVTSISVS